MKRLLPFIVLLAGSALAAELRNSVILQWDPPPDPADLTDMAYYIRCATNPASAPATNWPIVIRVANRTNVVFPIQPGSYSFVCQASNIWGLSDPSNVARTPAPPRSDISLGVR